MAVKERYFSIVMIDIDPKVEAEFNKWYNEVHLPPVMACEGYISGMRLIAGDPSVSPRYASVYEADSFEAFDSAAIQKVKGWGPFTDQVIYRQKRVLFKTAGPFLHKDEKGNVREAVGQSPIFRPDR